MPNHKINYFDIHCHLDDEAFDTDREEIIAEMLGRGIFTITIGVDKKTSQSANQLSGQYENIYSAIGLHPNYTFNESFEEGFYQKLLNENKKIICIGECGLDYFDFDNKTEDEIKSIKAKQKKEFESQIDFACQNNLPLMLHLRTSEALDDAYLILKDKKEKWQDKLRANLHFYLFSKKKAKKFLELGCFFSLPGPITYSNLDSLIDFLPLDKIMLETDSPYAAPSPERGKRNSPLNIKYINNKIAEVKKISPEEIRKITKNNALKFFQLKI